MSRCYLSRRAIEEEHPYCYVPELSGADEQEAEGTCFEAPPLPPTPERPPEPLETPPESPQEDREDQDDNEARSWFRPIIVTPARAPTEQWLTPATTTHPLATFDRASESLYASSATFGDWALAYPYIRRYAQPIACGEGVAFFNFLGLENTKLHRRRPGGLDEFALASPIVQMLNGADWTLNAQFDYGTAMPVALQVFGSHEINSSTYNCVDQRFAVAPMFAPEVEGAGRMHRTDWVLVQRGLLLELEELVRLAIHIQSATMHAQREDRSTGSVRGATLQNTVDALMRDQLAALISMMHNVVYAQRRAILKSMGNESKAKMLRQPIFNQRRLMVHIEEDE